MLGFFAKKAPLVRVFVNGEVIFTVRKDQHETKGNFFDKLSTKGSHSAGNVTGLSLSEFIALPARARLTLTYEGEGSCGEGFVGLRKM